METPVYTGTVKFFNKTVGYGMISPDDKDLTILYEKRDIMAHITKVIGAEIGPADRVEFKVQDANTMKYTLIVPDVKYDENLSDEAKELHRIISVLCNGKPSCSRSNKYFSSVMNISEGKVDRLVDILIERQYLDTKKNEVGLKAFDIKKISNGN